MVLAVDKRLPSLRQVHTSYAVSYKLIGIAVSRDIAMINNLNKSNMKVD